MLHPFEGIIPKLERSLFVFDQVERNYCNYLPLVECHKEIKYTSSCFYDVTPTMNCIKK